jgi:hypothetical protein
MAKKCDAETVIADFLGDIQDCHPRVGHTGMGTDYKRLRELAQVLIADLKENDLGILKL